MGVQYGIKPESKRKMRSLGKLPGVGNEEHESGAMLDRRTFEDGPADQDGANAGPGPRRVELAKDPTSGTNSGRPQVRGP